MPGNINGRLIVQAGGISLVLLLVAVMLLHGCTLNKLALLERNLQAFGDTGALSGIVEHRGSDRSRIIVTVFEEQAGIPVFVNATRVMEDDFFIFLVPPGHNYYLLAFDDLDGDMAYSPGEAVGMCGGSSPDKVRVNTKRRHARCDLKLVKRGVIPREFATSLAQPQTVKHNQVPLVAGEITDLNDSRFSAENGEKGLWAPFDFITEVGAGVYFLEPYDPKKIPVLFVSGAAGYPQQWKYIYEHMDRNRFQAWFYLYPSGARLETAGRALNMFVKSLHKRFHFQTLHVTAYSMGGLVARDFIIRNRRKPNNDYIKLFITISTPWSGHEAAALGTRYSPATIPSWIDMASDSEFQKAIFARPLDPKVRYYLLFGHKGRPGMLLGNNDGSVSMASMLRTEAQNDAIRTYGFDDDHDSILQSAAVVETYNSLLSAVP
jgi:hypothetical protein